MTIRFQILQCIMMLVLSVYSVSVTYRLTAIEERVELEKNNDELWKRARSHFFELPRQERHVLHDMVAN